MAPDRIAHYTILSRLGAGGMGEVFLADDTRLQRRVAIKRVRAGSSDPLAGRRLLTEARAAARLDHPNICPIHEVGEDDRGFYIVMPFVEGETLAARIARGPLPIEDAVQLGAQVTDALRAAHALGILHRDIKPANIMIDTRGQARVMDFGLAKITPAGASADLETASRLTVAGSTVGTAAYMSPEQARGEVVDERSDLFSLGVVLYEMIAGQRPFDGPSTADTISAILTREPVPLSRVRPESSGELQRIVAKALHKKKDERYQTAGDLAVDLRAAMRAMPAAVDDARTSPSARSSRARIAAAGIGLVALVGAAYLGWRVFGPTVVSTGSNDLATLPRIESIAVLPLANMSPDPAQEYVADGMTEALTTELARIKSLRVLSRTSTMQYKGTKVTMPEIARALNADALVEGSVIRDGDKLRITAQLIHGPTDRHLWADSYDGDLRDVLALQRRVAEAIAREVRATLSADDRERLAAGHAIDTKAQDAYLRGRQLFYAGVNAPVSQRGEILLRAIDAYNEALTTEPNWAEAWAAIAGARHWMVGAAPDSQALFRASREAAMKAIGLDDLVSGGHGALAYVSAANDWDFVTAEREFKRSIELGPSGGYHHGYAMMLSALGRHDEAKAMFEDAERRDPLGVVLRINAAWDRLRARDYSAAIAQARDVIARGNDQAASHEIIGWALSFEGHHNEAIAELTSSEQRFQTFSLRAALAAVLARAGRQTEARTRVRALERAAGAGELRSVAAVYACLGDREGAMTALERAYAVRTTWLPSINVDPAFDSIRDDPRFQALLRRVGIPARSPSRPTSVRPET